MHEDHVMHCFDYLRQVIMCFADSTLEWAPEGVEGTNGWGSVHLCRDYRALMDFANKYRGPYSYVGFN